MTDTSFKSSNFVSVAVFAVLSSMRRIDKLSGNTFDPVAAAVDSLVRRSVLWSVVWPVREI